VGRFSVGASEGAEDCAAFGTVAGGASLELAGEPEPDPGAVATDVIGLGPLLVAPAVCVVGAGGGGGCPTRS